MKIKIHPTLDKKGKINIPKEVPEADICLLLEGTYPFVSGGVSSWVHGLIKGLSEFRFSIFIILANDDPQDFKYEVPDNVVSIYTLSLSQRAYTVPGIMRFFRGGKYLSKIFSFHKKLSEKKVQKTRGSRTGEAVTLNDELTHLIDTIALKNESSYYVENFKDLIEVFNRQKWDISSRLFSRKTWNCLKKIYAYRKLNCSFIDYFWTWKYLHTSIFSIMHAYLPKASLYHAVSTGYAGLIGSKAAIQYDKPLLLTEHGIYNKERKIDISRSPWIYEEYHKLYRAQENMEFFKELWIKAFTVMSQICYKTSSKIITLYKGNQRYQMEDGADVEKMEIIPNGINYDALSSLERIPQQKKVIGFVGRIVPIKDVKTYLRAVALVFRSYPDSEAWLLGPYDENRAYYEECKHLIEFLGIQDKVKFFGMVNLKEYYPKLDILVLTSISEAQPLVILEAYSLKIPIVTTDVGGCRELVDGMPGEDEKLGSAGLLTGLANPTETALAILQIINNPVKAKEMGDIGKKRVKNYYDLPKLFSRYKDLYNSFIDA